MLGTQPAGEFRQRERGQSRESCAQREPAQPAGAFHPQQRGADGDSRSRGGEKHQEFCGVRAHEAIFGHPRPGAVAGGRQMPSDGSDG